MSTQRFCLLCAYGKLWYATFNAHLRVQFTSIQRAGVRCLVTHSVNTLTWTPKLCSGSTAVDLLGELMISLYQLLIVVCSAFSALTLWVGDRNDIQPVKHWVLVCWW